MIETPRPCCAEQRFQFREGQLNRIEVGTIGRQESELRTDGFDRRAHLRLFVDRQIVEDDHIAAPQRGHEDLFDVSEKARIVDRPIKYRRCREAVLSQRRHHGVGLPVAARRVIAQPRAPPTPAVATNQVGCHAALVEKDVLPHIVQRQPRTPAATLNDDVGPPLFVGVYGFF
jgi:hypothetical protein